MAQGIEQERSKFWDDYQQNGKRGNYNLAFAGEGWTSKNFEPKYEISPTSAYMMFRESTIEYNHSFLTMDFSKCTDMAYTFSMSKITGLNIISFESCTPLNNTFRSAANLTSVELILKEDGSNTFSNTFYGCSKLTSLYITGGKIGKNGFSVADSPNLSKGSLESILNALADKSADTSTTWKVTLGATNLAKLTDEQKAIATEKGWILE